MNYEYFEVENKMVILDTPFFKTCYYKYSMPAILFLLQIIKTLHARTVIGQRIYINISRNCSDIIRNVEYPMLEPKHDILDTCSTCTFSLGANVQAQSPD